MLKVKVNAGIERTIAAYPQAEAIPSELVPQTDEGEVNINAELGVGTNDRAQLTGNILEDEKILGRFWAALYARVKSAFDARAGDGAVLRHVADQDRRHPAAPRKAHSASKSVS